MFLPNKMVLSMTKLLNMDAGPSDVRPIFGKNFLRKTHIFIGFFFIKSFHFFLFQANSRTKSAPPRSSEKENRVFWKEKSIFLWSLSFFPSKLEYFFLIIQKEKQRKTHTFFIYFVISMSWKNKHLVPKATTFTFLEKIISMMPWSFWKKKKVYLFCGTIRINFQKTWHSIPMTKKKAKDNNRVRSKAIVRAQIYVKMSGFKNCKWISTSFHIKIVASFYQHTCFGTKKKPKSEENAIPFLKNSKSA